jgi:hypothetical protein
MLRCSGQLHAETLVELMAEQGAEDRAPRTRDKQSERRADRFAEPLHRARARATGGRAALKVAVLQSLGSLFALFPPGT